MATALATGAGMGAGVAALTAVCPPAGLAVGGVMAAKSIWTAGENAWNMTTGKTQTERKLAAKKAMIQAVNLGL